jgi:cold shock CspA family protein
VTAVVLTGSVVEFDEAVGLGTVAVADGRRWPFHCTQIADGSRVVDVGAAVSFEIVAGRRGSWEAAALRPVPARPSRRGPEARADQGVVGSP